VNLKIKTTKKISKIGKFIKLEDKIYETQLKKIKAMAKIR
jgi:hypothetical protein